MESNDTAEQGDPAARILRAADELISEVGYDAASVARVAKRAEVNKALVFYYFGSKDRLFQQVLERYYQAHTEALANAFSHTGTVGERLHRMLDAYFDFIVDNERYPRLVQQLVSSGDRHVALVQHNLAPLFDWITGALSDIAPAQGPLAARQFFVTFSGAVINYFTYSPVLAGLWGDDPTSVDALAERRAHLHWLADTIIERLEQAS